LRQIPISVEGVAESPRTDTHAVATINGKTTVRSATKLTMFAEKETRAAENDVNRFYLAHHVDGRTV